MVRKSTDRDELVRRATDYRSKVATIRADETLSPLGKRRQLEALYAETKPTFDAMRKRLDREEHVSRQELERRLFGLPQGAGASDAISYRDAVDRVARIRRPEELGELMERAVAAGDDMLLRAAAGHAWQQCRNPLASDGWDFLVEEYGEQVPAPAVTCRRWPKRRTRGRAAQLAEQMAMEVPEPKELQLPESKLNDQSPPAKGRGLWEGLAPQVGTGLNA